MRVIFECFENCFIPGTVLEAFTCVKTKSQSWTVVKSSGTDFTKGLLQ